MNFDGVTAPQIIIEVAWVVTDPDDPTTPPGFVLDVSQLGTGQLATSALWTDLADDLISIDFRRGRTKREDDVSPGEATIVLENWIGDYDPTNPNSPFYTGSQVRPMRQVRIRAVWGSTSYDLFRGHIEDFDFDFGTYPTVTMECVDVLARLAAEDIPELSSEAYADDTTGARIGRILDTIGWSSTLRDLDTGKASMAATVYGDNALALCQKAEETEFGTLYADGEGNIAFRDRHAQWTASVSMTVQATLSDDGTDVGYLAPKVAYGASQVYNDITGKRVDYADPPVAQEQNVKDTSSIDEFATRSLSKTDLALKTDTDVMDYVVFLLARSKLPELRISEVTVDALAQSDYWSALLGRDIRHRIKIERSYADDHTFTRELLLEGIEHSITAEPPSWRIKFITSDPIAGQAFILGTSKLDSTDVLVY